MNRKLKKLLREIYASEQPEHMKSFTEQLRKNQDWKHTNSSFARFVTPMIATLVLSVVTGYSYIVYHNTYQPYEPPQKIIPTETILLTSESATESNFQTATTNASAETDTRITIPTESHSLSSSEITSQTIILSDTITTAVSEIIPDMTEALPKTDDSEEPDTIIPESQPTSQTETTTQEPLQTLTRQEICNLFAQEITFAELSEQYHLYTENTTDTIYPLTARSADIPDMIFLFRNSSEQYILDAVKAPALLLLPELTGQPVTEAGNVLNNLYYYEHDSYLWMEDDSAIYDIQNLKKSDILSEQQPVMMINHEFKDYDMIHSFSTQFQDGYFDLYHPEIEDYYWSMNETDYEKIETLFTEIKRHIPKDHAFYQEWLAIESGSVKRNHHPEDNYDIARIYLEYMNYTLLINDICTELEQQLPESITANIKSLNKNWTDKETYFLQNVIPYHWDESHAEVVCFEAESAKCRCLILLMYLQDIA